MIWRGPIAPSWSTTALPAPARGGSSTTVAAWRRPRSSAPASRRTPCRYRSTRSVCARVDPGLVDGLLHGPVQRSGGAHVHLPAAGGVGLLAAAVGDRFGKDVR